jgi:hypothetical protein
MTNEQLISEIEAAVAQKNTSVVSNFHASHGLSSKSQLAPMGANFTHFAPIGAN